ncbi:MAG: S9 family peptidase [Symbiobacteriaceae bacterium]|nr:S9 family peptidase [Symbiobacteriaceae bacterium]
MRYSLERYLRIHTASGMIWLCDGESLVYLTNITGTSQAWRIPAEGGYPEQLTFYPERVGDLHPMKDKLGYFFTRDAGGNENHQIYMHLLDGSEPVALTDSPKVRHQFGGVTPDQQLIFACNARKAAHFDLCAMDIATKEVRILQENEDNYNTPAALSPDGRFLLYNKTRGQQNNPLYMLDIAAKTSTLIGDGAYSSLRNPVWCPDSKAFYARADKDADFDYIIHYSLETKKVSKIYDDNWEVERLALSPDGKLLAFALNEDGYSTMKIMKTADGSFLELPAMPLGDGAMGSRSWSPDSTRMAIPLSANSRPTDIWMLNLTAHTFTRLTYSSRAGIQEDGFGTPELHRFNSFDGLSVPTWVFRPVGAPPGPLPAVVSIHGGPEGQSRPGFNAVLQYFLNQGIAIILPNIRGSTGYGKVYQHLDDVEKRLDSVADINSLVEYIVQAGIADPKRIAVMGGSYGGYMTLSCIVHYPDLWAAAVDTVGMSDLVTFLENTSSYRRPHRESEYGSLEHHRDVLRRVSPIHHIDKVKTPLMVIHGRNDPRVPVTEAIQMAERLQQRGIEVPLLIYEDEGHGVTKLSNRLDCYPKVAEFLKKHLKIED